MPVATCEPDRRVSWGLMVSIGLKDNRLLHALIVGAVTAIGLWVAADPAHAHRVCYCQKADVERKIGIGRCGEMILHDPQKELGYVIEEEGRGKSGLDPHLFMLCPEPNPSCPVSATCPSTPPCSPVACTGRPSAEGFGIYGSNTIGEKLMPQLIEGYAQRLRWKVDGTGCNGPIRLQDWDRTQERTLAIDCRSEGSETAIPALITEQADIAMVSRPITGAETESMRREGFPGMTSALHEHVLALDGVSIIVAKNSSISTPLSLDQIAGMFSGSDGGRRSGAPGARPADVRLYLRNERSGTREMFEQLVMSPRDRQLPPCPRPDGVGANNRLPRVRCFGSSSELVKEVAGDPQGIGFVGRAYADAGGVQVVPISAPCGLVQEPSIFDIKTEDYLLSRRLLLYTAKVHSVHSPDLLFYALSDVAQSVIRDAGYVDQTIEQTSASDTIARLEPYGPGFPRERDLEFNADLMRDLRQNARATRRLSISFRFRFNSTSLDTKALQDVNRLGDYLTVHAPRGKVLLLGFTDALGDFRSNRQLSLDRAKAVESALLSTGIASDRLIAKGYSELLPVACNDSADGQAKNRRVEVWLLPGE
jgi:phosphate transport system substrate-binding protein